jgi:hypothetical protein
VSYLVQIQEAAEQAAGQPLMFEQHRPVQETFQGQTVWDGVVSQFKSADGAVTVYAWAVEGPKGEPQYVTVLREPPIDSPLAAVRAWLVGQFKK